MHIFFLASSIVFLFLSSVTWLSTIRDKIFFPHCGRVGTGRILSSLPGVLDRHLMTSPRKCLPNLLENLFFHTLRFVGAMPVSLRKDPSGRSSLWKDRY